MLDFSELQSHLRSQGVSPDSYSLGEPVRDECYCIVETSTDWHVFYSERGNKNDLTLFSSFPEAAEHFLGWVLNDPTTKAREAQLLRFWFRTAEGLGIGATGFSEEDAKALARSAADRLSLSFEVLEVVADIDVRTLDQGHVIPNMGPPNVRGVWFPRLNI